MLRRELPSISFADQNGDNQVDLLLACTKSGLVQGFTLADLNGDLLLDTLFAKVLNQNFTTPPVVQYPYFYIGQQNNQVCRFTLSGVVDSIYYFDRSVNGLTVISATDLITSSSVSFPQSFAPAVVDLNSDGRMDHLSFENQTKIIIELQDGVAKNVELPGPVVAPPSFGDADTDGFYEIFFNLPDRLYGLHYNGAVVTNFPIQPPLLAGEHLQGTPLLFDADGDQHTDIVTCTSQGQVLAFDLQGRLLTGFPLSAGGNPVGSPLIINNDADEQLELLSKYNRGKCFCLAT